MHQQQIKKTAPAVISCYLFVYGTLQRSFGHPMHRALMRYSQFVTEASIQAQLYEIAGYPGAILSDDPTDRVYGELYLVNATHQRTLFLHLDAYEECSAQFHQPHEYKRQIITTINTTQTVTPAWCYLYNHSLTARQRISSGRYHYQIK